MKMASLLLLSLTTLIITSICYAVESTEAQRQYDLAVSYIKSDLYEDGLKTLNQVAFLYPDSDVADDALYQLAMIREGVGDGKINIGEQKSIEAMSDVLSNLTGSNTKLGIATDILIFINANLKGKNILDAAKNQAIAQYILALDYLNTLIQRYPNSNKKDDTIQSSGRIIKKIESLLPQEAKKVYRKEVPELSAKKGCLIMFGALAIILITAYVLGQL